MNTSRKIAIIVGALFLIAMVTSLVGGGLLESILGAPDYLIDVSANTTPVFIGIFLELINGIAVVGIGVMMFTILKQHNERVALGYVGFRIIESVFLTVAAILPLSLIALSQEYVKAGASDDSYFQTLGAFTLAERYWIGEMLVLPFVLSALIFYYLLYHSRLVPRWLSGWGFVGAILVLTANLGTWLMGVGATGFWILVLPIIANELFLAIWLIVKGFNLSTITYPSAKADSNTV